MYVGECLDQVGWYGKLHLNLGRDILNADAGQNEKENGVEHKHQLFKNNLLVWVDVFLCAVLHVRAQRITSESVFSLFLYVGSRTGIHMKGSTANVFPRSLAALRNSALCPGMERDQLSQTPIPVVFRPWWMVTRNWAKQILSPASCFWNSVYHSSREKTFKQRSTEKRDDWKEYQLNYKGKQLSPTLVWQHSPECRSPGRKKRAGCGATHL